eukprot:6877273-Prymnesium_polylepis.1
MDAIFQREGKHRPNHNLVKAVGYDTHSHNTAHPAGNDQGSRGHNYLFAYERYFCGLPRNLTLLNIGILAGHSLRNYADYFGPKATIVGLDITLGLWKNASAYPHGTRPNIQVHEGDQTKPQTYERLRQLYPKGFDVIIDDGCHTPCAGATFAAAWPLVKPGGFYLVEDVFGLSFKPFDRIAKSIQRNPAPAGYRNKRLAAKRSEAFSALDVETVTYGSGFSILAKYRANDQPKFDELHPQLQGQAHPSFT